VAAAIWLTSKPEDTSRERDQPRSQELRNSDRVDRVKKLLITTRRKYPQPILVAQDIPDEVAQQPTNIILYASQMRLDSILNSY
jgi:hypothetical protein